MSRYDSDASSWPYLFIPDLESLKKNVATGDLELRRLFNHIQKFARCNGNERFYSPLLYLLTGEREQAEKARLAILSELQLYRDTAGSSDQQFHTWCNAAPLARVAAAYDWVADADVFSDAERAHIKDELLSYCWTYPYHIAQSRVPAFDNQIAAMSFCCTLIGFLYGRKRGDDLRAQRLMADGLQRFPDLFALSPKHGYSLEGSTYFGQIVAPMVSWYCSLVEQITCEDVAHRQFAPSNTRPIDILNCYLNTIGPTGLLPPWDNYGWTPCPCVSALAYLARKTKQARPMAAIKQLHLVDETVQVAWGQDDKVWTILFWHDEPADYHPERVFPSWAADGLGGALVNESQQWRLFQAWDECGAGVHVGRTQVNPNMITLELWGSVVLTDGSPEHDHCTLFDYPRSAFSRVLTAEEEVSLREYEKTFRDWSEEHWVRRFSYGLVGASNSIVVNHEDWYSPETPREGKLAFFGSTDGLAALAADAADFYRPHYPIERMLRQSVLVNDRYLFVCDRIIASEPLTYSWQAFARGEVQLGQGKCEINTPEEVRLTILPLGNDMAAEQRDVAGFPKDFEGCSTRIRYTQSAKNADFAFFMVPERKLEVVQDLADDWTFTLPATGECCGTGAAVDWVIRCPRPMGDEAIELTREFAVHDSNPTLFLAISSCVPGTTVMLNGVAVGEKSAGADKESTPGPLVCLLSNLQPSNTLCIRGTTSQGKLLSGDVLLMAPVALSTLPTVTSTSGGYRIADADGVQELAIATGAGAQLSTETCDGQASVLLAGPGTRVAALGAHRLAAASFNFWADRPLDVTIANELVQLSDISAPVELDIIHEAYALRIQSRGVIDITVAGQAPCFCFTMTGKRLLFVNGQMMDAEQIAEHGYRLTPEVMAAQPLPAAGCLGWGQRAESLYRRYQAPNCASEIDALVAALDGECWQTACVAAELLGRLNCVAAIPALIACVQREDAAQTYNEGLPPFRDTLCNDPSLRMDPDGIVIKRHRLKTMAIQALGRLRAREAVDPLCSILADQTEFYPVHSITCWSLARIGDERALPALTAAAGYAEVNTAVRAADALSWIRAGGPANPDYPGTTADGE